MSPNHDDPTRSGDADHDEASDHEGLYPPPWRYLLWHDCSCFLVEQLRAGLHSPGEAPYSRLVSLWGQAPTGDTQGPGANLGADYTRGLYRHVDDCHESTRIYRGPIVRCLRFGSSPFFDDGSSRGWHKRDMDDTQRHVKSHGAGMSGASPGLFEDAAAGRLEGALDRHYTCHMGNVWQFGEGEPTGGGGRFKLLGYHFDDAPKDCEAAGL